MRPGDLIGDRFELVAVAGAGGMGVVYRAVDRSTGATVALKLVAPTLASGERFGREARALAELGHPGIVRYLAHGRSASAEGWLAMEWLDGEDLAGRLAAGRLALSDLIALGRRLGGALGHAHHRGLVHRDVKPGNVFLPGGDLAAAKLLDFGIARTVDATLTLTRPGALLGTPSYMSPEQATGQVAVDARADVYSLGAVLYECAAGRPPFEGVSALAVLSKVVLDDPIRLRDLVPGIPSALDALILRMLAKDPQARPVDGDAVEAALAELASTAGPPTAGDGATVSITPGELSLLSVVLVSAVPPAAGLGPILPRLKEATAGLGARVHGLADGSILLAVGEASDATRQVARAARGALAARALLPDTAIAVATGRAETAGRAPAGEAIDRAVELLSGAQGSPVRIDAVTARLLPDRFVVREGDRGAFLLGEEDAPFPRRVLRRVAPCVGRDRELRLLETCAEEAFDGERAQVVVLAGPAGIGKSRLLDELAGRVERQRPDATFHRGRAEPIRAGSPFAVVGGVVRSLLGLAPGETPAPVRVAELVKERLPAPVAARAAPFLGEVIGARFPDDTLPPLAAAREEPSLMVEQVRRAFEELVLAGLARGPLVILLEDMHWGDQPTVALVDAALRAHADRALLVVATGRPETFERFPRLWDDRAPVLLRLGELRRAASRELMQAAFGAEAAPEVVTRIVERAGGNPFYLEELVRAHAEGRGGEPPGTVLAVLAARLEALPAPCRRVLRAASVLGTVAWRGAIETLLGGDPELDDWLSLLEERELLGRQIGSRFAGEIELAFRHALVRDAAYATLTTADLELGHRLAARWLAGKGEDGVVLAEHHERGRDLEAAASAYADAAEEALEVGDLDATLSLVGRAVDCHASGVTLGRVRGLEVAVLHWRGDAAAASSSARAALELLPVGSEPWFRTARDAADVFFRSGEIDAFATLADQMLALAKGRPVDRSPAMLVAWASAAMKSFYAGRFDLAERLSAELRARPAPSPLVQAYLHQVAYLEAQRRNDFAAMLATARAAHLAFVEIGDERRAINQLANVAVTLSFLGQYGEAERVFREARASAAERKLEFTVHLCDGNLCFVLAMVGRLVEAEALAASAIAGWRESHDLRMEAATRIYLARAMMMRGELDRAATEAARAAADLELASPPLRPLALAVLAQIELARGRVEEARSAADLAHAGLDGIEEGETLVRLAHAEALRASGDAEGARDAIEKAAARIRAGAGGLADPEVRRVFLEAIPENARTLALAGEWSRS